MHILVFCYLVVVGYGIARIVFGYRRIDALFLAPLSFSLVITIVSAAVYVTGAFTPLAINGIAAAPLLVLLAAVTLKKTRGSHLKGQVSPVSASGIRVLPLLLIGISLLLSAASIALLLSARTTETTLGPWDVVDPIFFSLIASNALTLLILSKNEHAPLIGWYAAAGAYIGTASAVTAVIYPLGFGFDPILHRAAETLIAQQGFIDPRTLYYGGHYGLVTTLSAMFSLTSATVDRFIVPVLTAISIPVLAYRSFLFARAQQADRIAATLMIVGLPIAALGSGTPWGYALLLTTVVILTSIQLQYDKNKTTLAFLAAAVLSLLFVHPLAGLPIGFIAAGSVLMAYRAFSFRIAIGCVVAAAASAPIAFIANSLLSRQLPVTLIVPDALAFLSVIWLKFTPFWEYRFNAALDFAYFFIGNANFFLLVTGIAGAAFLSVSRNIIQRRIAATLFVGSCAMFASFIILRGFISFPSLPEYERTIYADRMAEIAFLFLFVLSIYAIQNAVRIIAAFRSPLLIFTVLLGISLAASVHVYASYPRNDGYTPYHGYTIAQTDIDAVRMIASHADGAEFIVLANQVVSSASVREYGFRRYYQVPADAGMFDQFYYPIPAGSPLSVLYREMLAHPSRSVAERAMKFVGVSKAYFVVNRYEPRFRTIIEMAKQDADDVYVIGDDSVTVLYYELKL